MYNSLCITIALLYIVATNIISSVNIAPKRGMTLDDYTFISPFK